MSRTTSLFYLLVCTGLLNACAKPSVPMEVVNQLVARCSDAMVRNVCVLMKNGPALSAIAEAQTVMVAGLGRIDAQTYRTLKENGNSMCEVVRKVCLEDWEGKACQASRIMYPSL